MPGAAYPVQTGTGFHCIQMAEGTKLILLPGMDGTGYLFAPLLSYLSALEYEVIPLPCEGGQDADSLAEYVSDRLPDRSYVLLAESFSGPLAANILHSGDPNLRGIIFVASFLSRPGVVLPELFSHLPIKLLAGLPLSSYAIRAFLLGWGAGPELIALFRKALDSVPGRVLKDRLKQISGLRYDGPVSDRPTVYIRPGRDHLVEDKTSEFKRAFPSTRIIDVAGPHFILQACPNECAVHIVREMSNLV